MTDLDVGSRIALALIQIAKDEYSVFLQDDFVKKTRIPEKYEILQWFRKIDTKLKNSYIDNMMLDGYYEQLDFMAEAADEVQEKIDHMCDFSIRVMNGSMPNEMLKSRMHLSISYAFLDYAQHVIQMMCQGRKCIEYDNAMKLMSVIDDKYYTQVKWFMNYYKVAKDGIENRYMPDILKFIKEKCENIVNCERKQFVKKEVTIGDVNDSLDRIALKYGLKRINVPICR